MAFLADKWRNAKFSRKETCGRAVNREGEIGNQLAVKARNAEFSRQEKPANNGV